MALKVPNATRDFDGVVIVGDDDVVHDVISGLARLAPNAFTSGSRLEIPIGVISMSSHAFVAGSVLGPEVDATTVALRIVLGHKRKVDGLLMTSGDVTSQHCGRKSSFWD